MNKNPILLIIVIFIITACGASNTTPTLDSGAVQTSAINTAWAVVNQTSTANVPTITPFPTNSPTSTPNPTATLLIQIYEIATAQAGWQPSLYEPFSDNVFGWCDYPGVQIGDDGDKSFLYFDNGVYHMTYTSGDKYPQTFCAPYGTYYDFQVSVLTKLLTGDPETSYGVIFRVYNQSFKSLSRFIINPANEYRIDSRDPNNNWTILQDWTKSYDMKPQGEWNKITISCVGPVFTFYINDSFQTRLTYNGVDSAKGAIGLVVNSDVPRKSIEVLFDDFTIREP